jgi:tyramine---L-glutamate ligase
MKILIAEYAVGAGIDEYMLEGRAMLGTLVRSFVACGHEVLYPSTGTIIDSGTAVETGRFEETMVSLSRKCDAGLVIAPDEILGDLTEIIEENTTNLGCPSDSVRLCADKLESTRRLARENIPVPLTLGDGEYKGDFVIKPRFGCASEGIHISKKGILMNDFIATEFIGGEHLSASIITGKTQLLLTVNRQFIKMDDKISYEGGMVPYLCDRQEEIADVAKKTTKVLGCHGYAGVDIVLADKPYVVDVNPRPTTSLIGIAKVMKLQIADLIIKSAFGELPQNVEVNGCFTFKKDELFRL